ncbi:MAG: TonB-dependent receptor plug domain-containing protein [Methylococcaceae bacterium]
MSNLNKIIALLIGFAVQPLTFAANEATSTDQDDLLFQEIPSVYSAAKFDQKVSKAPASISIVTADEIKKYGYRTFGDILASLKGFYNTNDRNYGYAGVRGFGLPSDYNTRLLLLIDGHRFNDSIQESFDASEGFPLDIDAIERIEVVRGPGSSLYGSSAFFGVLNVISKRGRDQQGANVSYSYGSNDANKASISYGDRFKNGLEAFITGTFYDNQGYDHLYYKEFDDPFSNNGVSVNNDGEQAKKLMANATFGDFTFQGLYVNRNKNVPTASFNTLFNNPDEHTLDQSTFVELKYDHTFANQLNLKARASYNQFRETGDFPTVDSTGGAIINKDLFRGQWFRYELEASKIFWDDHRITLGGEFQDNYDQFMINYDTATYIESDTDSDRWAVFIQDEYSISQTLTLNAGVRFDYFSIFGETINPRIGLIYNPWRQSSIKLLYGTAFRGPSQYEMNYNDGGVSSLPSENLKPEKLETLELILEHYFSNHLRGELNVFHTNITDIIASTPVSGDLVQQQNSGDINSDGVEIQLEGSRENGLQSRISYSWQNTRYADSNEDLTNSPEHMVKLNLIAPLWMEKLFLGFETRYVSTRATPPKAANNNVGGNVGDYAVSNLTLFSQDWVKGMELSSGVYNLFDQRYFDPGSTEHRQNGIEQDGITFRIKASLNF